MTSPTLNDLDIFSGVN